MGANADARCPHRRCSRAARASGSPRRRPAALRSGDGSGARPNRARRDAPRSLRRCGAPSRRAGAPRRRRAPTPCPPSRGGSRWPARRRNATRKRCKVDSAWLERSISQPADWVVCFLSLRYTAIVAIASETAMTGTSMVRATRSAVRWRVPVSEVGIVALGTRCTLARAMREASAARMMAPSILANSERRCGLYSASSRKPPVQTERTAGSSPTTISAPCLACRIRSNPSRSLVPGAIIASASFSGWLSSGSDTRASYPARPADRPGPRPSGTTRRPASARR